MAVHGDSPGRHPGAARADGRLRALEGGAGRLLTVREAAERLAVSTATVYALCERGELPLVRVSNALRIAPADLSPARIHSRRPGGRPAAEAARSAGALREAPVASPLAG